MRKMLAALVLCTGCMVPGMNEVGMQMIANDLTVAKEKTEVVAVKTKELVEEITAAQQQEREPVIAPLISEIAVATGEVAEAVDEAGKTTVTMQTGLGTPKPGTVIPETRDQKESWRTKYLALAKLFDKFKAWASSRVPFIPKPTESQPAPWSATDIGGLILAILGSGLLGKKGHTVYTERKALSLESEKLAEAYKAKCNGDGEFADTMREFTTITADHRKRKVNG